MSKKYILLSILLIAPVLLSGCIFENDNKMNQTETPDFIPQTNLPAGFTFLGINNDFKMNIENSTFKGVEGVYRNGGEDIYIQTIKNDNAGVLLSKYREELRQKFKNDPFEEITINGHPAVKFNDVRIIDGKQQMRYSIMWAKQDYMVQVGSFADFVTVVSLASATGY